MPVEDVREAHFLGEEELPLAISDVCSHYGDALLSDEQKRAAEETGLDIGKYVDEYGDFGTPELAQMWVDWLMLADPGLELRIVEKKTTALIFYGYDERGRHLRCPGYGMFE
jgi:hypothetical protein